MALNIKNKQVAELASELARLTGETKTEVVRRSLEERRDRLQYTLGAEDREGRLRRFLENQVWPRIPEDQKGRKLRREEEDAILGYGPKGI
jgi:antitoxin VapB